MINKVTFEEKTLIDLTNDTVNSKSLLLDTTAHASDGNMITGSLQYTKDGIFVLRGWYSTANITVPAKSSVEKNTTWRNDNYPGCYPIITNIYTTDSSGNLLNIITTLTDVRYGNPCRFTVLLTNDTNEDISVSKIEYRTILIKKEYMLLDGDNT